MNLETNSAKQTKVSLESLVGRAADEFTQRLERGEQPRIEEYTARYPQIAAAIGDVFPVLQMMHANSADVLPPREKDGASGSAGGCLGDYRLIREIGRGGMGVVYEAEQISLNRRVALKVLPFAAVLAPTYLQRFKNEAQAAAHLHHTNIVPVFSVGCERNVHYYAMQYIDGQPLSRVIQALREVCGLDPFDTSAADGPVTEAAGSLLSGRWAPPVPKESGSSAITLGATNEAPKTALQDLTSSCPARGRGFYRAVAHLGVQAASALQHAHEQGILHRDIKPSNLLLDVGGNVWITDFGLALMQTDSNLTMPGDLLGTVRYMSPEQALAKRVPMDHRTDIYSLGTTLYELLTLQPAFEGSGRAELLHKIAVEDPRPLRAVVPTVPRELQTIVLKAMAKNPHERFATAQEMAADLSRFLEDKPILAKPPTVADRLAKWARRHRTFVAAAVVVLVVAVCALAASTVMIAGERAKVVQQRDLAESRRREAELARREAVEERERAEANSQMARELVDDMLTGLAEDLAQQPRMETLRKELLEKAAGIHEQFLAQKSTDPAVRLETGRAYLSLARINYMLGDMAKAEEACRHANSIFEALVAESPRNPEWRKELARTHRGLAGVLQAQPDRISESETWIRSAVTIYEALAEEDADEPEIRLNLAGTLDNLGLVLNDLGRPREAEGAYERSIRILEELCPDCPNDARCNDALCQKELARCYNNHGIVLGELARPEEQERNWRKAVALLEKLVERYPQKPSYRHGLAVHLNNLGSLLAGTQRVEEATDLYFRAISLRQRLVLDFPRVPEHQEKLAHTNDFFARALKEYAKEYADPEEAESVLRQAAQNYRKLAAEFPFYPRYQQQLHMTYRMLADVLVTTGRLEEAEAVWRDAIQVQESLVASFPDTSVYGADLARSLREVAGYYRDAGRMDEAEKHFRQAIEVQKNLAERFPQQPKHRDLLTWSYRKLGELLVVRGRLDEAESVYRQGVDVQERLLAEYPDRIDVIEDLAPVYVLVSDVLRNTGRSSEADEYIAKCRALWERVALLARQSDEQAKLFQMHVHLGRLLSDTGLREEGLTVLRQGIAIQETFVTGDPTHVNHRRWLALTSRHLGVVLLQEGGMEQAKKAFQSAVDIYEKLVVDDPDWDLLDQELQSSRQLLASLSSATSQPTAGPLAHPSSKLAVEVLGLAKTSPVGVARAVERVQSVELDEEECVPFALLVYGEFLTLGGEAAPGARLIRKAIDAGGTEHWYFKSLGWALACAGQKQEAAAAFTRALGSFKSWRPAPPDGADPDHWTAAYFLDLVTQEQFTERWLSDEKHKQKFAPFAWFYVGQRAEIERRIDDAVAAYEKAVELGQLPNAHPTAHYAAYRLEVLKQAAHADSPATPSQGGSADGS